MQASAELEIAMQMLEQVVFTLFLMYSWLLLGREVHNKEEKGMKEAENVVEAKSSQLESLVSHGTQALTHVSVLNIVQIF